MSRDGDERERSVRYHSSFRFDKKNSLVQTPESTREGLYFVKEGKLRLYKLNESGKKFTLRISTDRSLSIQKIANMVGTSREAVSGVMSELAKEGVVKTSRLSVQLAVTIIEENIPRNN